MHFRHVRQGKDRLRECWRAAIYHSKPRQGPSGSLRAPGRATVGTTTQADVWWIPKGHEYAGEQNRSGLIAIRGFPGLAGDRSDRRHVGRAKQIRSSVAPDGSTFPTRFESHWLLEVSLSRFNGLRVLNEHRKNFVIELNLTEARRCQLKFEDLRNKEMLRLL